MPSRSASSGNSRPSTVASACRWDATISGTVSISVPSRSKITVE